MINNKYVIPTVFSTSSSDFKERFDKLIKVAKNIQIDFMDGKFVKAKSIDVSYVPDLHKYKNIFEAHLMVINPEKTINSVIKKGFKKSIFHIETINLKNALKFIHILKENKLEVFIAINPNTKLNKLDKYISYCKPDGILFLGVNPGKEGQKLDTNIFNRIKHIKKKFNSLKVQVDGGVNDKTASKLFKAGADILNSGSFVSNSNNPEKALKLLERMKK